MILVHPMEDGIKLLFIIFPIPLDDASDAYII